MLTIGSASDNDNASVDANGLCVVTAVATATDIARYIVVATYIATLRLVRVVHPLPFVLDAHVSNHRVPPALLFLPPDGASA